VDVRGTEANFRAPSLVRGVGCAGATDTGPSRTRNEDAYWISADGCVLVVADGLGGLPQGQFASETAVGAVAAWATAGDDGCTAGALARAAEDAQRAVAAAAATDPGCRGMATTLAIALLPASGAVATVLHVGDSRVVLWRGGSLQRRTFDHGPVGNLHRDGTIDAEQARRHPARNIVGEVVGLPEGFRAEVEEWPVERGDLLVLCTDGVSDALPEAVLAGILVDAPDAATAASRLLEAAATWSGQDNATVIVRRVT